MARTKQSPATPDELEAYATVFRAFGDATRLALLQVLREGSQSVGELATAIDSSNANVSKHLQILNAAGLLHRLKEGTSVRYSIRTELVDQLCLAVCSHSSKP